LIVDFYLIAFPFDIKISDNLRLPQWRLEIAATILVNVWWKCSNIWV